MEDCVFCKIVNNEIKAYKISESENFMAFLDSNPLVKGHTLLVTKEHRKDIYDLNEAEQEELGKEINKLIKKLSKKFGNSILVYSSNGSFASQSVRHFHVHLIPRKEKDRLWNDGSKIILDRSSGFERLKLSDKELEKIAEEISD